MTEYTEEELEVFREQAKEDDDLAAICQAILRLENAE